MNTISPEILIFSFIGENYGRPTAEAFQNTFKGEDKFDNYPPFILENIKECVYDLVDNDLFEESVTNELRQYLNELQEHIFHGIG